MAVNFAEMPVTDGFRGCYDYNNFDGAECVNLYDSSGLPLNIVGGTVQDGSIYLPQTTGHGYVIDDIGNNFTVYAIVKGDTTTDFSGTSWGVAVCGTSSTYRVFCGQTTSTNLWAFFSPSSVGTAVSASDWHVIAYSVNNGLQALYIDGALILSSSTAKDFSADGLYINTGAYNGAVPDSSQKCSAPMYLKFIGYAVDNHSAAQIKFNSDWLLVQYGFMSAPLDSKMSGADAAAIAWVIARNLEQTASLTAQKRAYRKGIKKGSDGEAEIDETWETPDSTIDLPVDEDGVVNEDDYIDLNKGIQLMYANPDDPTDTCTVKIYMDHTNDLDKGSYGHKGRLRVMVIYNDGSEGDSGAFLYTGGYVVYHLEWNTANSGYPRYFTKYQLIATNSTVRVRGYRVHPNQEAWTTGAGGIGNIVNPSVNIPDGYVYVGAKNYDSTATTEV